MTVQIETIERATEMDPAQNSKKERAKRHTLQAYLEPEDLEELDRDAKAAGVSRAAYVRRFVLGNMIPVIIPSEQVGRMMRTMDAARMVMERLARQANAHPAVAAETVMELCGLFMCLERTLQEWKRREVRATKKVRALLVGQA